MKLKLNRTYTTIAVYSLIVIAFALILCTICFNIDVVFHGIGVFFDKLSSLFFGLFFTFCLLPLVRFFERVFARILNRKKEHPMLVALCAAILVDLLVVALLALVIVNIIPAFISAYNSFRLSVSPQIEQINDQVQSSGSTLWSTIINTVFIFFSELLSPDSGSLISTVTSTVSNIFSKAYEIVLGLVLATYFLICRRYLTALSNKLFTAFLPDKFRNASFAVVKRIYNFFVEFFSYRLVSGFTLALITYLLCLPFHIPYGIIIALLVFVANFVPVIGPIIATLVSTILIAVFSPLDSRLWQALIIFIILAALHIVTSLLVEPFFLRKKLRPGPGIVVTCAIVFYAFFGFSGIIFSVPLYTSVDVAYREIQARLLARKNLPLNNAYYVDLKELPITKASKRPGVKLAYNDEDAFEEMYGMTPQEASESGYVFITDQNEVATDVVDENVPPPVETTSTVAENEELVVNENSDIPDDQIIPVTLSPELSDTIYLDESLPVQDEAEKTPDVAEEKETQSPLESTENESNNTQKDASEPRRFFGRKK